MAARELDDVTTPSDTADIRLPDGTTLTDERAAETGQIMIDEQVRAKQARRDAPVAGTGADRTS